MSAVIFRVIESYGACSGKTGGVVNCSLFSLTSFVFSCASRRELLDHHDFAGDWSLLGTETSEKFLLFCY